MPAGKVWEGIRCSDAIPEEHYPCGEALDEDAQQQRGGIATCHIADDA